MLGGERDRIAEAEAEGFVDAVAPASPSALLAMTMIGLPARRTAAAKCRSAAVRPARASKTNRIASQSASAASVCARMRPASVAGSPSSRPAVSTMVKARSASRASPSRRSRVTPGSSSTSASLRPTSRLNSVDLPTFGRPMIATLALMSSQAGSAGRSRRRQVTSLRFGSRPRAQASGLANWRSSGETSGSPSTRSSCLAASS